MICLISTKQRRWPLVAFATRLETRLSTGARLSAAVEGKRPALLAKEPGYEIAGSAKAQGSLSTGAQALFIEHQKGRTTAQG
jgi:hypothetical protein